MSDTQHRFRLSFALVECLGCGVKRIRGAVCADCGARPAAWEANYRPAERRVAADAAAALLDGTQVPSLGAPFGAAELQELASQLDEWMSLFFSALRSVADAEKGAEVRLRMAVGDLADLRALVTGAARRRPWLAAADSARECVGCLVEMTRSYLRAISDFVPLEAQRHADVAQRHMDAAGACLESYAKAADRLAALIGVDSLQDQLLILLGQAAQDFDGAELSGLSARAEAALAEVVGTPAGPGCGVGLQFALQDAAARACGDSDRFRKTVRNSYALFFHQPELLAGLAASTDFPSDIEAALLETVDAAAQAAHAMSGGITRQMGRSLTDIAAGLVEGPGQLVAIAMLVGSGRKTRPYEKLRQDDATKLLQSARSHPDMGPLLEGFNLDLRNAQAHRMVRYDDDGVTAEIRSGPVFVGWDDLVHEVLLASESVMGCLVGLMHALSQLGISVIRADIYQDVGITPAGLLSAAFVGEGCADVTVDERPESWTVHVSVPASTSLTIMTAGIAALVPQSVPTLTLIATRPDGRHVLTGPTSLLRPFRDLSDPDGDSYGLAITRMQRIWTHNGEPCITQELVRCWAASQVKAASYQEERQRISRLRAIRAVARDLADPELADALSTAIRSTRLGDATDARTAAVADQLTAWGRVPVIYDPV